MIRRLAGAAASGLERGILAVAFVYFRRTRKRAGTPKISWVVGAHDVASMITQIASVIPGSYSVALTRPRIYDADRYDWTPSSRIIRRKGPIGILQRVAYGPVLLAKLATRAGGVLYVGPHGFLRYGTDQREHEFKFLKRQGLRIGIYWCGSDIRSSVLMHELERETGMPNIFTYVGLIDPHRESASYEKAVRTRASLADTYADIVFDNPTDQKGYGKRYSEPFYYFMGNERFTAIDDKFSSLSPLVVVHAATSPVIKGTQLVRAAIQKLRDEGYKFEYVEMLTSTNDEVLEQLRHTHIALNQFYGFTPAVFGAESLAAGCAVLQSADGDVETSLAPGANEAWVVTKHHQVYDNLKNLLDHPETIRPQAVRGQDWARKYCSASATGEILRELLEQVLDGNYDRSARALLPAAVAWTTPGALT
jgi:hypothetical protein